MYQEHRALHGVCVVHDICKVAWRWMLSLIARRCAQQYVAQNSGNKDGDGSEYIAGLWHRSLLNVLRQ